MDVSLFFVRRRCWGANRNREWIGESGFFMEDEKLNKEGIIGKNGVHKPKRKTAFLLTVNIYQ